MIRFTFDHFEDREVDFTIESMPQYGIEKVLGLDDSIPNGNLPTVKFKLFDDDGSLMYEGELSDDDECENQSAALRWGETMAGCTTIKVERNGTFVQEIG